MSLFAVGCCWPFHVCLIDYSCGLDLPTAMPGTGRNAQRIELVEHSQRFFSMRHGHREFGYRSLSLLAHARIFTGDACEEPVCP